MCFAHHANCVSCVLKIYLCWLLIFFFCLAFPLWFFFIINFFFLSAGRQSDTCLAFGARLIQQRYLLLMGLGWFLENLNVFDLVVGKMES
jgi:hypothetical protein